MAIIDEHAAGAALVRAFSALPELSEHEKATLIHELAETFKASGWCFDENQFAERILHKKNI